MPENNDGEIVLDHDHEHEDEDTQDPNEREEDMPADSLLAEQAHQQIMIGLQQSGNIAQNNMITVQKIVDYDYMENKRIVTLDEAIGVREVSPGPYAQSTGQSG